VRAVAVHPTERSVVYAATETGGVQRSEDGGRSWEPTGTEIGTTPVLVLAVDPLQPDVVYAGSSGDGLYRSANRGGSWENLGPKNDKVASIVVHPVVSAIVWLGTERGVSRTTDGGLLWIGVGLNGYDISALVLDAFHPTQLFAGAYDAGSFVSGDGGTSWEVDNVGLPTGEGRAVNAMAIASGPGSSLVYAGTQAGGVFRQVAPPPTTTTTLATTTTVTTTTQTSTTMSTTSTTTARTTTTTSTGVPTTVTTSSSTSSTTAASTSTTVAATTSTAGESTSTSRAPTATVTTSTVTMTSTTAPRQGSPDECTGSEGAVLRCLVARVPHTPACAGEVLRPKLLRRLRQAARLADRADRGSGRRKRRALRGLAAQAKRAGALALRLGARHRLTIECAEGLWGRLVPIGLRAQSLAVCDPCPAPSSARAPESAGS
jgi:hypothetical protein